MAWLEREPSGIYHVAFRYGNRKFKNSLKTTSEDKAEARRLPAKAKSRPKPKVADGVREAVDAKAAPVVATLKRRFCKNPQNPQFNWPDDFFTRWHRDALYFVVVMRTPSGRPPIFETHAAQMEHVGGCKFNLAVPMRRGWNTFTKNATPEECLKEISESICF